MDTDKIKKVLQNYFDAGYQSDGALMAGTLHDDMHVFGHAEDGSYVDWDKNLFVDIVGSHPPGASEDGYPLYNEIISIIQIGENAAAAEVKLRVMDMIYTDILSFICLDGEWKIISKLFAGVPAE